MCGIVAAIAHRPVAANLLEGVRRGQPAAGHQSEAYPARELKHGPLALIDEAMPVVALAANNALLEKLKSNLEEVRARGGQLFVFADFQVPLTEGPGVTVIRLAEVDDRIAPLIFSIPMQLLAYHVAVLKGTDVDQPRNLAKSVTVEALPVFRTVAPDPRQGGANGSRRSFCISWLRHVNGSRCSSAGSFRGSRPKRRKSHR